MLYGEGVSRQVERTLSAQDGRCAPCHPRGPNSVVAIGPPGDAGPGAMLSGAKTVPPRLGKDSLASTFERDRVMRDVVTREGADYVSMAEILCGDDRTCLTLVPGAGMTPMQFDTAHLTPEGSLTPCASLPPASPFRDAVHALVSRLWLNHDLLPNFC